MVIVGAGRIGTALAARARERGVETRLVTRSTGGELGSGPVLVATRNDDLDAVVDRVPAGRRGDLVFVQNGMLRPWLAARGLSGATRGLLFLAVAKRGDPVTPGGESPFCGPHADAVVGFFRAIDLPARVVSASAFGELELEKLIWNSAFGVLCQRYGATVGEALAAPELAPLVAEMAAVGRAALGVDLAVGPLVDRLVAYTRTIPDYRAAVKEWRWRNGWLVDAARDHGVATPVHAALLAAIATGSSGIPR